MANISGNRAFEHLSQLILPPERISGSEAEAEGAKKVRDLLSPYMDSCELEGVPVTTYLRGAGRLEVISPGKTSFPCEVNAVSASAKGEGVLLDVSRGTREDYEKIKAKVKGGIVLVTIQQFGGDCSLWDVAHEAKHQGAACVVYHTTDRAEDLISVHVVDADIPVISVSRQSAIKLRKLLSQHKEVRCSFESNLTKTPGTSYNVVGTIRGSQFPQEIIYVAAHHDTFFYGANDNNSTTACLLELADFLQKQRPKHTIKFVIHGSEESGAEMGGDMVHWVRGSYCYTEAHRSLLEGKEADIPFCVINGECLGAYSTTPIQCTPDLRRFVEGVVDDLEEEHPVEDTLVGWTGSDHFCYHTLGVPTIMLMGAMDCDSSYFRLYHTPKDDLKHVSPAALEANAKLYTLLVARLDAAEGLPYSLEDLVKAAKRGLHFAPNKNRIKELLEEKEARCAKIASWENKLKATLDLARVIHKNIFGFANEDFVYKFITISDTVAKLKEAHRLIDTEGDLEDARKMLLTIPGANHAGNFSQEVMEELDKQRNASPLYNRLSNFSLDLTPILGQITRGEPKKTILSNLESRIKKNLEAARTWGVAFEKSLTNL